MFFRFQKYKFFYLSICIVCVAVPLRIQAYINDVSKINIAHLDYADIENNEAAQLMPIPARINEIIYPTLGFPSLIQPGRLFSIILNLSKEQKAAFLNAAKKDLRFQIRLSPNIGYGVDRKIPSGFEKYYASYADFIEHYANGEKPFRPFIYQSRFKPERMGFTIDAVFIQSDFHKDKLVITAQLPKELPELYQRALDLEVKIFNGQLPLVHDIQYHCIGLLKDKQKFRFIHMADPQINNTAFKMYGNNFKRHPDLSNQEFALLHAAKEMNFIHPDFAFISGDLTEGGNDYYSMGTVSQLFMAFDLIFPQANRLKEYHLPSSSYWNEYSSIVKFIRLLNFPVFSALGNHDGHAAYQSMERSDTFSDLRFSNVYVGAEAQPVLFDGKHYWQKIIGPRYYSFDFGDWHFVVLDTFDFRRFFRLSYTNFAANDGGWISQEQMVWLELDLKVATEAGKNSVLIGHHDPRGGVAGMYYEDPSYRRIRRKILKFDDELWYQYQNYSQDELFASPEWASSQSEVEEVNRLDAGYDSAKELLRLIGQYHVTHVFLGHVHADYSDVVTLGGRKVHFIHSTALAGQPNKARHKSDYKSKEGEGPGLDLHWGYRVFEADQSGRMTEIFTKADPSIPSHPVHRSLELGNIRAGVGYEEFYRRQEAGILSAARPYATWLPFGSFLKRLDDARVFSYLYKHFDPILAFRRMFSPDIEADMRSFYQKPQWSADDIKILQEKFNEAFPKIQDQVGVETKSRQALLLNQNDLSVSGVLEFMVDRPLPNRVTAHVVIEDLERDLKLKEIALKDLELHQFQVNGPRWVQIPVELPGSYERRVYLDITF